MSDQVVMAKGCACVVQAAATLPGAPWWWAPVLTAALAVLGAWVAIRFDQRKSINQELIKKRVELYAMYVPMANDLYCYFKRVGNFRRYAPADMLKRKRDLDAFIHLNGPLFSSDYFTNAYFMFIDNCFSDYQGAGVAAKLRADKEKLQRQFGNDWKREWDTAFDPSRKIDMADVEASYHLFVAFFAWQIGARRRPWAWPAKRQRLPRVQILAKTPPAEVTTPAAEPGTTPDIKPQIVTLPAREIAFDAMDLSKQEAVSDAADAQLTIDGFGDGAHDNGSLMSTYQKTAETLPLYLRGVSDHLSQISRYRFDSEAVSTSEALGDTLLQLKQRIAKITA